MRFPSVPLPEAAGPSMAMIIDSRSSELCPELCHQFRKVWEARRDHARIVDRDCLACAEAKREECHGDAVIHVGRDKAAAFDLSTTHDDQIIALDSRLHTACRKASGSGRQPIAFLLLEFRQPLHAGLALGEASEAGKHRIFIDHRRRALWRYVDALESACPHPDVAHRLPGFETMIELFDVCTHLAQGLDEA